MKVNTLLATEETMIMTAVFFGAIFFLKEIPANPKCSVSVFQNKSVAYIISEPTGPGCLPEWTSANTVLVDEKGNIYHPVVLHAEPQRILTIDCQHNVTYHTECLELWVSLVVKCDYKCPNAPVVAKDTTMVKLPYTGRTHVVTLAVSGISLLLGFVIVIIIIYKYRLELELESSMNHDLI